MNKKSIWTFLILLLALCSPFDGSRRALATGSPPGVRPYFGFSSVQYSNSAEGSQTLMAAQVFDPTGTVPDNIASLTVAGPDGFWYDFTPADFIPGYSMYFHLLAGAPAIGEYRFTATNVNGSSAVTYFYLKNPVSIPLLDSANMQASGDPLAPTLSWAPSATYEGNAFYMVYLEDSNHNFFWTSDTLTNTSLTLPSGLLESAGIYYWRVVATDSKFYFGANSRSVSSSVPLTAGTRPYFTYVQACNRHRLDGFFTSLSAKVNDPTGSLPGVIQSIVVTGPNGFSYTFQPADYSPASQDYYAMLPGRPADGIYAFTVTSTSGQTAVSYDYSLSYDVPLVDSSTLQASGDPLAPMFSWGQPAIMDRSLYYQVNVMDGSGADVWKSQTVSGSSLRMPTGILQSGTTYQWKVRAHDNKFFPMYNRSDSAIINLAIDNARPYFDFAAVYFRHKENGFTAALDAMVKAPGRTVPDAVASLAATGPGGFSYAFQPSDYTPAYGDYESRLPGQPADGVYTFTLTDTQGASAVTHDYIAVGSPIPLFDEASIQALGDPLAPTISWSGIPGYEGTLYYRVRVQDANGFDVYASPREPYTAVVIPLGILQPGSAYAFRLEATDAPEYVVFANRSQTRWIPLKSRIDLASGSAIEGSKVRLPLRLVNYGGVAISATSNEIYYDPAVLEHPRADIGEAASYAGKEIQFHDFGTEWCVDHYCGHIRVGIVGFNNYEINDGTVAYVEFDVKADALTGDTTLTNDPSASSPDGNPVDVGGAPATVTVVSLCGDCNNDGIVDIGEVQAAVNMYLDESAVEGCADPNGDGRVVINELQLTIVDYLNLMATDHLGLASVSAARQGVPVSRGNVRLMAGRASGRPGADVRIPIGFFARGAPAAALSDDIVYDSAVLENPRVVVGPAAMIAEKEVKAASPREGLFRVGVLGINDTSIPSGIAAYVTFTVKADALPGRTLLKHAFSASSPLGAALKVNGKQATAQNSIVRILRSKQGK